MAVSASLVAKVGAAGTITAGGGWAATYYGKDYVNLYATEREAIRNSVQLKVVKIPGNEKSITVSVAENSSAKLADGHAWSCEITTIEAEGAKNYSYNLIQRLSNHLPTTAKLNNKENKELLVRACSGSRVFVDNNRNKIKGKLTLKQKTDSDFEFTNYPDLKKLLSFDLKEVEQKVIDTDLKLKATSSTESQETPIKITVATDSGVPQLPNGYVWSCEITLDDAVKSESSTLAPAIQSHLFKDNQALDATQKKAKSELVKACSQARKTNPTATNKTVTGTLTIKQETSTSSNKYFENHKYLDYLLTTKS